MFLALCLQLPVKPDAMQRLPNVGNGTKTSQLLTNLTAIWSQMVEHLK